jgi:hypothetical protein
MPLRVRARPDGGLHVVVGFPTPNGAAPADAAIQAQAAGRDSPATPISTGSNTRRL